MSGPTDGHKYRLINIANGTALGLGEDHHCAVARERDDDDNSQIWTFQIDNEGRWKIQNSNSHYLTLHEDVDPEHPKSSWIATSKNPMPSGWNVEADRDPKDAFRIYYGDSSWLVQQPIKTPAEWTSTGADYITMFDIDSHAYENTALDEKTLPYKTNLVFCAQEVFEFQIFVSSSGEVVLDNE
ncbi:hypothetical protein EUX98_g1446 [Antrodiella citrinella]|uniref:Ricin B lectin domain-containing protein n=1 Tax=Antrodiella citrinella TaxID=2447956 RepID=A0A4S4N4C4_9APHY|nr:hypothetical protein EUX98_g1446 [Antrodiella citrinella]